MLFILAIFIHVIENQNEILSELNIKKDEQRLDYKGLLDLRTSTSKCDSPIKLIFSQKFVYDKLPSNSCAL